MKVKLLGHNDKETIEKQIQIIGAATSLSRSKDKVVQVYETCTDYQTNLKIIKQVLKYGHTSISEHDYIVFGLEDVTPIIEQTIISYRLTSFTIKSRRESDFSKEGYYVPTFYDNFGNIMSNNEELQYLYNINEQNLFDTYNYFVESDIPYEDARYILPYSYHANHIFGSNAHTLYNMLDDFLNGPLSHITEIKEFATKMKKELEVRAPYIITLLEDSKTTDKNALDFLDEHFINIEPSNCDKTELISCTPNGDYIVAVTAIAARYQLNQEDATKALEELLVRDKDIISKIIKALLRNKANRELETVSYNFEFPSSLAVLTHFTRHRMWSLLIPSFVPIWNLQRYIVPETIKEFGEEIFNQAEQNNILLYEEFKRQGVREEDLIYFYISGNVANIRANLNARFLYHLAHLRTCRKTQWETRGIVNDMVRLAKEHTPLLAEYYGPNCEVWGNCEEGKDSCYNRGVQRLNLKK